LVKTVGGESGGGEGAKGVNVRREGKHLYEAKAMMEKSSRFIREHVRVRKS